jgi:hypothetical protein
MGSLPSFRMTGRQVWSRIRNSGFGDAPSQRRAQAGLMQTLVFEVQRVSEARTSAQRATQLARVLDAVSALAEAHGLNEGQLQALRRQQPKTTAQTPVPVPAPVSVPVERPLGLKQQLKVRAVSAVARAWAGPRSDASVAGGVGAEGARAKSKISRLTSMVPSRALRKTRAAAQSNGRQFFSVRHMLPANIGRSAVAIAGSHAGSGLRLVAASLLHMPRLHRRAASSRPVALAVSAAPLARQQTSSHVADGFTAAALLLWSGRSGLQLTYQIASAGAQLWLRRHVLPRVLRYVAPEPSSLRRNR